MITAIYARQSLEKKDSLSIETQIEFCRREVFAGEEVEIYTDEGYSGKNTDRPAFQRMMRMVKQNQVNKIVVYKLDRISRSVLDFANLIDIFNKYKVTFRSTQEQFDTGTPMGNAMLNVTMVFAQLERETIQQRIIDNYNARGKKGCFMGGPPPFGFQKAETMIDGKRTKTLAINHNEAAIIKRMYDMYGNQHCSLSEIARVLNAIQDSNIRKSSWDNVRVAIRLRNPIYVQADAGVYNYYKSKGCIMENSIDDYCMRHGCFIWGKRQSSDRKYKDISDHHVALSLHDGFIDPDLFIKCQYILDENTQINNGKEGTYTWLTGLVKCMYCGRAMCICAGYKDKAVKTRYLRCSGRALKICTHKHETIKVDDIERLVQNELFGIINSNKHLINAQQPVGCNSELNIQKAQISKIDDQIQNLVQAVADGNQVVGKYLTQEIERLELEKQQITNRMKQQNVFLHDNNVLQLVDTIRLWDNMSVVDKRKIARLFIKQIDIGCGEINITWKYNFKEDLST